MKPSTILPAIQLLLNNVAPALRIRNNYAIQFALAIHVKRSILNALAIACCLFLANCTKEKVEPGIGPGPASMDAAAGNAAMVTNTTSSPLDNLNIIEMPIANGYLFGNIDGTGLYNFNPAAREVLHPDVASRVIINPQQAQSNLSVNFIKGGTLPSSGKPFYFLKVADKYLSVGLIGLYFADATPQNEQLSKWVFTKGPQVTGAPGNTFVISSIGFGTTTTIYSLQVLRDESRNEYYIGFRPLNSTNRQQVFSIVSSSSLPPNTK